MSDEASEYKKRLDESVKIHEKSKEDSKARQGEFQKLLEENKAYSPQPKKQGYGSIFNYINKNLEETDRLLEEMKLLREDRLKRKEAKRQQELKRKEAKRQQELKNEREWLLRLQIKEISKSDNLP